MPDLSVRAATARDAAAIADVHVRSWRAAYRGLVPDQVLDTLSVKQREREWRGWLTGTASTTLVAEAGGAIVGFCTTSWRAEGAHPGAPGCEIAALYVDPDVSRRGVGAALMARSLETARERGRDEVTLWVLEGNDGARNFYEGLGFVPDGGRELHIRSRRHMYRMRARL